MQAAYVPIFAHELTKRYLDDDIERLTSPSVETQVEISHWHEQLINEVVGNLQQKVSSERLFALRWKVV